jgi:hypothetical protein
MIYCLDTSGLLDGWKRHYPIDVFPDLPDKLEQLADDGRLIVPEDVLHELEKKDDELRNWAKKLSNAVVPLDEPVQEAALQILGKFQRLVDTRSGRSGADPFLIATAQVRGAMVITGEEASNNLDKPRIPDVCRALGVPCGKLLDLIRREQWTFRG